MSRSRKKNPISKDNQGKQLKKDKRRHSRMIRNFEDLPSKQRSAHKRVLRDAWDIHDYVCRWTKEEAIEWYHKLEYKAQMGNWFAKNQLEEYPTLEDFLNKYWARMIRK